MKKSSIFTIATAILLFCSPALSLSPPEYSLWREINASFGASPYVTVDEIIEIDEGHYEIDIHSETNDVSTALAAILVTAYNFGGIEVKVNIFMPDGSTALNPLSDRKAASDAEIKGYFDTVLTGNPYFDRILEENSGGFGNTIWLQFKKKIILFWNDNISDYYGNNVYIAADVFESLVKTSFETDGDTVAVGFTTRPGAI